VLRVRFSVAGLALAMLFAADAAAAQQRYVLSAFGNEVRYRVREQLVGIDLPSDAVGVTNEIEGGIAFDANWAIDRANSKFTIDLTRLQTDSRMRDNYVRRNVFAVDTFPKAEFVPTELKGLTLPLPASGEMKFDMVGELTIHGVTKPTTWTVVAQRKGDAIIGKAVTRFKFADFNMRVPRVSRVLSVDDDIRLEYDFRLEPPRQPRG
jgi:polyisoprenoid-binding protein YceI